MSDLVEAVGPDRIVDAELLAELERWAAPGWPRRWVRTAKFGRMPLPWVVRLQPLTGRGWAALEPARAQAAYAERRCAVCGEQVDGVIVLLRLALQTPLRLRSGQEIPLTDGPGAHPRCAELASRTCPHLRDQDGPVIGYLFDGAGCGSHEVQAGERSWRLVDPAARPVTRRQLQRLVRR